MHRRLESRPNQPHSRSATEERAEVANLLLESLDHPTLEEASQVWGEIAAERYQEMKADWSVVVELDKVLQDVKSRLK